MWVFNPFSAWIWRQKSIPALKGLTGMEVDVDFLLHELWPLRYSGITQPMRCFQALLLIKGQAYHILYAPWHGLWHTQHIISCSLAPLQTNLGLMEKSNLKYVGLKDPLVRIAYIHNSDIFLLEVIELNTGIK